MSNESHRAKNTLIVRCGVCVGVDRTRGMTKRDIGWATPTGPLSINNPFTTRTHDE